MGSFGIGVYRSLSGGTTVASGFPAMNSTLFPVHPYSGVYGGQYGYLIDNTIRAPMQVTIQPPQSIGLDTVGIPVVRGYPEITWSYGTVRPDIWYHFQILYRLSGNAPPGFQFIVLLQYPDPAQNGAIVKTTARWNPPTHGSRDVGAYYQMALRFSYVGEATVVPGTPIQTTT